MPFVQYYTYVEITPREHQALWYEYERIAEAFSDTFAQQQLVSAGISIRSSVNSSSAG